ncbi:MAG: hypothetical protein QME81_20930 [bacterium]|nr:hypothetical protein [bacterium]
MTNAAILLFGNDPQKFFLQARVRCARFKGTVAVDFLDMKLIDGNIIDQIDMAEKFILSHIKKAARDLKKLMDKAMIKEEGIYKNVVYVAA